MSELQFLSVFLARSCIRTSVFTWFSIEFRNLSKGELENESFFQTKSKKSIGFMFFGLKANLGTNFVVRTEVLLLAVCFMIMRYG